MKVSSPAAVKLLLDGSLALSEIEGAGVRVDMGYLESTTKDVKAKIAKLERKMTAGKLWRRWQKVFGHKAKIGSREQLGTLLFKHMGYKPREYTEKSYDRDGNLRKDARARVDKSSLDYIDLPFVKDFVKVENLKKTLSTYLDGLRRECVQHSDGNWYVHCFYNLNTAASFRSSANLINFQNQPKRDEEMANFVRRCYLPHPGHMMIDFDFSTLEVRIAYCYHKDPVMHKYLTDESTDMHRDTAADLFMLPQSQIDKKTTRDSSKNMFVFPEFYGSVYFQCAKNIWEAMHRKGWKLPDLEVTVAEHLAKKGIKTLGKCDPKHDAVKDTFEYHVKEVERKFWRRFRVYDQWKKDVYQEYLDRGYFTLHTGFVIHTHHKRNDVINYGTQGSAFHCLLWCLIKLVKWLRRHKMKSKVIGEVHDSASLSVHPKEVQAVVNKMHRLMTVELQREWDWIIVPLKAEVEVAGVNEPWSEQKLWVPDDNGVWGAKA